MPRTEADRSPTRVLWLAKGLGPGGMERLLVHQARFGDRDRVRYVAAYLTDRPNSVVPELEQLGVACHRLGAGRDLDPRWLVELRRLIAAERIDVVHAHSPMPAALARPLLRTLSPRPRMLYTEHNSWDCYGRATRMANACTYVLDDLHVAVSTEAVQSVPRALRGGLAPMVHGIDLDAVRSHAARRDAVRADLGLSPDDVVVIVVANLRTEKAYDVLLPAAQQVLSALPSAVFLSVGQGPLASEMAELHRTLGLGDRFRFLGFRSDVADLLAAADVFSLSSRHEGLPVSLMEATALGLPVVATRVGGLGDVLTDGLDALLVPAEQPDALADAYRRVIADPDLRNHLSQGSAQLAAKFDARVVAARWEALYELGGA
ncbi:MAG: glycosyltransferase [Actinomycetes bacterium]